MPNRPGLALDSSTGAQLNRLKGCYVPGTGQEREQDRHGCRQDEAFTLLYLAQVGLPLSLRYTGRKIVSSIL